MLIVPHRNVIARLPVGFLTPHYPISIAGRLPNGRVVWRGRFRDIDELEVFLWSFYRGKIDRDPFARELSFPVFDPRLAHQPIVFEFALGLDGHVTGTWSSGSSFATSGLTTANAGDVIPAFIWVSGSSLVTVSSLSTTGVTWQGSPRSRITVSSTRSLELWYGTATAALANQATTVNLSGTPTHAVASVFGVSGANTGSIADSNGSLPATVNNGTATTVPKVTGVSTSNGNDMIIAAAGDTQTNTQTAGAGFTLIDTLSSFISQADEYEVVSATQSNITVQFGSASSAAGWGMIVDAIQAAAIPVFIADSRVVSSRIGVVGYRTV